MTNGIFVAQRRSKVFQKAPLRALGNNFDRHKQ